MLTTLMTSLMLLAQPASEPNMHELLPGIRVGEGRVEFDASIAIDAHHLETPEVYLEMFVTAPDSREHEALVVTSIKPSSLHAALLAAGFEPGAPYSVREDGGVSLASGDSLLISVALGTGTGSPEFTPITAWAVHIESGDSIDLDPRWNGFVFAGSKLTRRGYEADGAGTIASLTTFANEVIAPAWSVSHEAEIDEPVWIADRDLLPVKGTGVIVRIEREQESESKPEEDDRSHQPERIDIDRDP